MLVLLFVFWIVLNARVTLEVIIFGIIVSGLVSLFAYRVIGVSFATEKKVWAKIGSIVTYLAYLVVEVIEANVQMIMIILSPKIEIKPQLVYFDSPVRSMPAKVALANSITLTPGTITIKMDDEGFGIHAIDEKMGDGIEESAFVKRLRYIEGGDTVV